MSKLYNLYLSYKEKDNKKYYLFKSGMFYIFIDEDAKYINKISMLKLTNLTNDIVKCGFPCDKLDKYISLFNNLGLNVEIVSSIDNDIDVNKKILRKIKSININKITPLKALNILSELVVIANE